MLRGRAQTLQRCLQPARRLCLSPGYPALDGLVDVNSASFRANAARLDEVLSELRTTTATAMAGGGERQAALHQSRAKMLPRQRIEALLDPGSPFMELSTLAGHEMYGDEHVPSGGLVTGVGSIQGRLCMIVANDATVRGGTYYPITVKKHLRAQKVAIESELPCVYLVELGGGNLSQKPGGVLRRRDADETGAAGSSTTRRASRTCINDLACPSTSSLRRWY